MFRRSLGFRGWHSSLWVTAQWRELTGWPTSSDVGDTIPHPCYDQHQSSPLPLKRWATRQRPTVREPIRAPSASAGCSFGTEKAPVACAPGSVQESAHNPDADRCRAMYLTSPDRAHIFGPCGTRFTTMLGKGGRLDHGGRHPGPIRLLPLPRKTSRQKDRKIPCSARI